MVVHTLSALSSRFAGAEAASEPRRGGTVERAAAGDPDAFGELYREHVGRVFALCLRLEGDARRAEDLTQDAFVRAWERLATFRGDSAFSTWLHRLTVNLVLGQKRSTSRRLKRVEPVDDLDSLGRSTPPRDHASALDLEDAIARLPDGARAAFVLHDVEGYSHAEIGESMGIAEGTSRAQLFRARRLLREMLER